MMKKSLIYFCSLLLLCTTTGCQESDDTPEAYPDWQNRNEQAFQQRYQEAKDSIAAGKDWMLVRGYMRADYQDGSQIVPTDYVVVQRLGRFKQAVSDNTPYYTDSVAIHYTGKLIPSTYYPTGLVFDSSFYGKFDPVVSSPYEGKVSSFIEGFSSALQRMRPGDHCMVYIPYQLGYGSSGSSSIPAYSMLVFELWMEDFWTKEIGDRY